MSAKYRVGKYGDDDYDEEEQHGADHFSTFDAFTVNAFWICFGFTLYLLLNWSQSLGSIQFSLILFKFPSFFLFFYMLIFLFFFPPVLCITFSLPPSPFRQRREQSGHSNGPRQNNRYTRTSYSTTNRSVSERMLRIQIQ